MRIIKKIEKNLNKPIVIFQQFREFGTLGDYYASSAIILPTKIEKYKNNNIIIYGRFITLENIRLLHKSELDQITEIASNAINAELYRFVTAGTRGGLPIDLSKSILVEIDVDSKLKQSTIKRIFET